MLLGEGNVQPQIRVVQEEFFKLWANNTHGFQIHFRTFCDNSLDRREGDVLTEEDSDYRTMLARVIEHDVVIWRLYALHFFASEIQKEEKGTRREEREREREREREKR